MKAITEKQLMENYDFEWPILVTGDSLLTNAIAEAMSCREYYRVPRNVYDIERDICTVIRIMFEGDETFSFEYFYSYDELHDWLRKFILPFPSIQELNISDKDFEEGEESNDEVRFITRFSAPGFKEDDFVDLGAYIRNLCHRLIKDAIDIHYGSFRLYKEEE